MKKRAVNYAKYSKEELIEILKKRDRDLEKLKEDLKTHEKILENREMKILEFEEEKREWFEIEKNAESYANYKQMKQLKLQAGEYEKLYNNQLQVNRDNMKKYQARLENTKEVVHNERGAGRKLQEDEKKVKEIILKNKDKSLRNIEKILLENGEKISIMTIRKIKKEL